MPVLALLVALSATACSDDPSPRPAPSPSDPAGSAQTLVGHDPWAEYVSWSPDGSRLASAGMTDGVRIWDAATGQTVHVLDSVGSAKPVWTPDSARLITSDFEDETVLIWDATSGALLQTLDFGDTAINLLLSPDGSLLAAEGQVRSHLWDTATGELVGDLGGEAVRAWSPDSVRFATSDAIWDAATGDLVHVLEDGSYIVTWSPDGKRLAGSPGFSEPLYIWDAQSGSVVRTIEEHTDSVNAVAWSPDSTRLASVDSQTVRIFDAATGAAVHTINVEAAGSFPSLTWSPDGALLALRTGMWQNPGWVWDTATATVVYEFEYYGGGISDEDIAWSPDSARVATVHMDGPIRIETLP